MSEARESGDSKSKGSKSMENKKKQTKEAHLIKKILVSLFVAMAAASSCLAQSITVAVGPTTAASCTFSASSLTDGFANSVTIGGVGSGASAGRASLSPVTILKSVDKCSIPLLLDLFKGSVVPTVVITLMAAPTPGASSVSAQPELTLTLMGAFVNSLSDSDSISANGGMPSEKVTLIYQTIRISDPTGTLTCSALTSTCS
jgi:type VI protein secretion system component Hcp